MWEEVLLFLVSFGSQILMRFGVFLDFILVDFNAISIYFYEVKSFICINFA